ncbi:nuclear transport factor 2 family protein [Actinomadura sp. HBU206391]|uniref:nuclear transport factor 2 family protein n=1 Tax=Actinomadura sp. HBU206391 TaxID=2731692 RepID=UPI00164FC730|nr:nuclear transport factor 2 family protein [Actinomadura sp. HBU206391]MBC6461370.1 nuclear transport factor 2 family protein [Actinomadura sp. HBU206391]
MTGTTDGAMGDSTGRAPGGPLAGAVGRLVAAVLTIAVIGLAVAASSLGLSVWRARDAADREAGAEQAARQTAVNMVSIDYRNIQQGIDRVLGGMTGDIKNQWATQAKTISDTATKNQATSTVQSVRAGVVSIDGDSAEVIVAVTAVTSSPKVKQAAPRYYRFSMDLKRVDGRWLVSKLGLVP